MGNEKTLALIAKAAKKLRRLDPDFNAKARRNKQKRTHKIRRQTAREYHDTFARFVSQNEAEIAIDVDVVSVMTQDATLIDLAKEISFGPTPTKGFPIIELAQRFSANGETHTINEWSSITGISRGTLRSRLRLGWPIERAISVKPDRHAALSPSHLQARKRKARTYTFDGKELTLVGWANETGINIGTLNNRLRMGWPIDRALSVPVGTIMGAKAHDRGWERTFENAGLTSGGGSRDIEAKQAFSSPRPKAKTHDRPRRREAAPQPHDR